MLSDAWAVPCNSPSVAYIAVRLTTRLLSATSGCDKATELPVGSPSAPGRGLAAQMLLALQPCLRPPRSDGVPLRRCYAACPHLTPGRLSARRATHREADHSTSGTHDSLGHHSTKFTRPEKYSISAIPQKHTHPGPTQAALVQLTVRPGVDMDAATQRSMHACLQGHRFRDRGIHRCDA